VPGAALAEGLNALSNLGSGVPPFAYTALTVQCPP
jgi:hypothetical protein